MQRTLSASKRRLQEMVGHSSASCVVGWHQPPNSDAATGTHPAPTDNNLDSWGHNPPTVSYDDWKSERRMKVVWNPRSSAARKIRPLLVPLFLFGCTSTYVTPPPPVYTPPEPRPAVTVELISNSDFESTWSALIEYTASTSFSIHEFERESGLMTLSFSTADPKTIVDVVECGQWAEERRSPMSGVRTSVCGRAQI